jgi:hypothetical protein
MDERVAEDWGCVLVRVRRCPLTEYVPKIAQFAVDRIVDVPSRRVVLSLEKSVETIER